MTACPGGALFENLESGATLDQFLVWFPGVTRAQAEAVLGHAARSLKAEAAFDLLITTDRNLRHQQNLAERRIAILVLPTTSWPRLQQITQKIAAAIDALKPGQYVEVPL